MGRGLWKGAGLLLKISASTCSGRESLPQYARAPQRAGGDLWRTPPEPTGYPCRTPPEPPGDPWRSPPEPPGYPGRGRSEPPPNPPPTPARTPPKPSVGVPGEGPPGPGICDGGACAAQPALRNLRPAKFRRNPAGNRIGVQPGEFRRICFGEHSALRLGVPGGSIGENHRRSAATFAIEPAAGVVHGGGSVPHSSRFLPRVGRPRGRVGEVGVPAFLPERIPPIVSGANSTTCGACTE